MLAAEDPKITDWMQAWGSIAGLAMSTLAVLLTGLLFRHEIRVRRDEKESSESAQAQLIVLGVERYMGNEDEGWTGAFWFVRNESAAPISNLIVSPRQSDDLEYELFAGRGKVHKSLQILTADSRVTGLWEFDDPRPWRSWESKEPRPFEMEMLFLDAAGVGWLRTGSGQPVRSSFNDTRTPSILQLAAEAYGVPFWAREPVRWIRRHSQVRRRRIVKRLEARIERRWKD
ncbi:hypothetical protein [Micromonospora coxensis]|uniref:hypothetical protein n=1 Tax=Micromonospora coxensis TaxID=356852 RepID=UPI0012FD16F1|nr:hypothetical protein [Micromonospora coxensis]